MSKFQLNLKWLKDESQRRNNTGCIWVCWQSLTRALLSTLMHSSKNYRLVSRSVFRVFMDCLHCCPSKRRRVLGCFFVVSLSRLAMKGF